MCDVVYAVPELDYVTRPQVWKNDNLRMLVVIDSIPRFAERLLECLHRLETRVAAVYAGHADIDPLRARIERDRVGTPLSRTFLVMDLGDNLSEARAETVLEDPIHREILKQSCGKLCVTNAARE
jgi:hypothetical protein